MDFEQSILTIRFSCSQSSNIQLGTSLNRYDPIRSPIRHQSHLLQSRIISSLGNNSKPRDIQRNPPLFSFLSIITHLTHPQILQLLHHTHRSIPWQPKRINKLKRRSFQSIHYPTFLLDPCLHQHQFPWLFNTQTPTRKLMRCYDWNHIIDIIHVILTVSSYKIFIQSLFVHPLGHESCLDVIFINHTKLGYPTWLLIRIRINICLCKPIRIEKSKLFIINLVYPS